MITDRRRGVRFVDLDGETHYHVLDSRDYPVYVLLRNVYTISENWTAVVALRALQVTYRREWWFIPEGPLVNPIPYPWVSRCPKFIAPSIYGVSMVPEPCQRQFGHVGPCSTTYDRYIDVVYREEP